jgi:hypothetical protein
VPEPADVADGFAGAGEAWDDGKIFEKMFERMLMDVSGR